MADVPMQVIWSGVLPANLRTRGPGVGVRLVKHEVLERGLGEHLHVGQASRQHFELPEVGEQDAWLTGLDVFLGATLFEWGQGPHGSVLGLGIFSTFAPSVEECLPGRTVEPINLNITFVARGRADPLAECDTRAAEHVPKAVQLVVGQGVHRVDEDRRQAGRGPLVPLTQQVVNDRVQEGFRLARTCASGDQHMLLAPHGLEYLLLVQVHGRVADQPRHHGMEDAVTSQLLNRFALGERLGQRNERPLDQWNVERRRAFQELAGLIGQFRVGQRKRREQVPEELVADAVSKLDRVDRHFQLPPFTVLLFAKATLADSTIPLTSLCCSGSVIWLAN